MSLSSIDIVKYECSKYHEKMFLWLVSYVLEGEQLEGSRAVEEFCCSLEQDPKQIGVLVKAVACSSPGKFGEVFFRNRPEFSVFENAENEPWRFYPEQWEAIEYEGDLLICAGAGTGKTRLLACKGLWTVAFERASVLVVTNTDNARNQIFNEMVYQIHRSEFLGSIFPEGGISKGNTKEIKPSNPNYGKIQFCLSGDGEQVLGIQIGRGGYLILDEVAMYKNVAWAKILSRARRGCRVIAGSVPYGKKGNRFEGLLRKATDLSVMKLASTRDLTLSNKVLFAKVRWNREQQPGWTKEEETTAIEFHGPKEGWEYRVYVKGEIADPEGQVFLEEHIRASFVRVPLYRALKILWDASSKTVRCSVSVSIDNINDVLSSRMMEVKYEEFSLPGEEEDDRGLPKFNITRWVVDNLPHVPVDVGGLDSGKIQDPSVLLGFEDTGNGIRCRWSIVSLYLSYPMLTELIAGIYNYEERNIFNLGIGIEAAGHNIASAIWEGCRMLGVPERWLSPFSWQNKVILTRKDGVPKRDESSHEVKRSLKHHLTVRMIDLMTKQVEGKSGSIELPACDEAMRVEFSEHAGSYLQGDFKYDDEDDHYIEASRVGLGRYLMFHGGVEFTRAADDSIERLTLPREKRRKNI